MSHTFLRATCCCPTLMLLLAILGCGGSTDIIPVQGTTSHGSGGNTLAVRVPDGGESPGSGGSRGATPGSGTGRAGSDGAAAGRGGMTTACVAGAACAQGFGCDQPCRMAGRAGLIACSCGANNVTRCGACVAGAIPTCASGAAGGQSCQPGMGLDAGCHPPCSNGTQTLCTCVAAMIPRGGGGANSGTWRCVASPTACM